MLLVFAVWIFMVKKGGGEGGGWQINLGFVFMFHDFNIYLYFLSLPKCLGKKLIFMFRGCRYVFIFMFEQYKK